MTVREGKDRKQIHLAAQLPGVNGTTVDFDSFVHLARTAERGLFDFVWIHDLTVLAALAAVTDRLGLVGTVDTRFNEPFEVARQFATLDHLSDGRSGWNMVTSSDAFTSNNFRRGDFLDSADRYRRAEEFITVARAFWDSWEPDAVQADSASGVYADVDRIHAVDHRGAQFDVRGVATLPAGPQGHPILLQASDFDDERDFGVKHADAMFTPHSTLEAGQTYYADVKARAAAHDRNPNQLKVFREATFVLGDSATDAADRARHTRLQQVSGQQQFVGTAEQVADEIDLHVQSDACDGIILVSDLTPNGLDEFVDAVVPLLQERGAFRTAYYGDTLRDHLGL